LAIELSWPLVHVATSPHDLYGTQWHAFWRDWTGFQQTTMNMLSKPQLTRSTNLHHGYQQGLKGTMPTTPQGSQGSSRGCKIDPKTIEKQAQRKNLMKSFGNAALLSQYGNTFAESIDRFQHQQGYNGPQSQVLMKKYKSHCCIP
jgi:hypothetical protein